MRRRNGFSLVEVIVVIAIIAVLFSLLVPAVQAIRARAARAEDQNNLRQIITGLHHYASLKNGQLPGTKVPSIVTNNFLLANSSPLYNVLPFIEPGVPPPYAVRGRSHTKRALVKTFISPTDPTIEVLHPLEVARGPTCYVVNMQGFSGSPSLVHSFPDGTGQTIALSQRYVHTWKRNNFFHYNFVMPSDQSKPDDWYEGMRSGTFADQWWKDVVPVKRDGQTLASLPRTTFQVAPPFKESDGRLLQATQPQGLLVAMFDGHVRTYSSSVAEWVFWAAITPNGGEQSDGE